MTKPMNEKMTETITKPMAKPVTKPVTKLNYILQFWTKIPKWFRYRLRYWPKWLAN